MRKLLPLAIPASFMATPALAAKGPFFSLGNTDFVVLLGLLVFIAVLVYFKVPGLLGGLLDKRAEGIQSELDEARALREEAKALLASYKRKAQEVEEQADRLKAQAREEAAMMEAQAQKDLEAMIERRMAAAEGQIASAEGAAIAEVRNKAASVAVAAAREVVAAQMSAADANKLIDTAIDEVGAKLH